MCQLFVTLLKNNIKHSCLYVDECDVKQTLISHRIIP